MQKVSSREDVSAIIGLGMVDLIIPRGSNQLVRQVTSQAHGVPVLGHAEGICHIYIDTDADLDKALHIGNKTSFFKKLTYAFNFDGFVISVEDAKCSYP